MKRCLMLLILVITAHFSFAQKLDAKNLVGSWKPVRITMEEGSVVLFLSTDSVFVSEKIKKTWTSPQDSAMAMMGMKMLTKVMKDLEMVFKEDSVMIEKTPTKSREGSYIFDEATSILLTRVREEKSFFAKLENGALVLEMAASEESPKMVMYLARQKSD